MKRNIRPLWLVTLLALGAAVGAAVYTARTRALPVRTAEAATAPIKAWVEERARTSLPHIYHITMPMEGRILPLTLEEGDPVKAGQIVAELEDIQWQENRIRADSIISAMENWVKASQSHVKASEISRDYNLWNWKASQKLAQTKAISEMTAKESRRKYLASEESSQESLANYQATRAFLAIMELLPAYVNRNLARTRIKSPKTGTILKRHVWNEKVMTPGAPILDIGNLGELELTADILSQEAVRIRPGQVVEIFGTAIGPARILGQVRRVAPNAIEEISSLGVEEQRVPVTIRFDPGVLDALAGQGRTLGLNYQVRVRVIVDRRDQTLTIPRTALFRGMDRSWQVWAIRSGRAVLTRVDTGLFNDFTAEVLKGLVPGDQVILAPGAELEEGIRVTKIK